MKKFDLFGIEDFEILENHKSYSGFFRIRTLGLRHRLFNGGWSPPLTRELAERGHAAGVLLYDPDRDAVVLLEQFRVGALTDELGPWMLEIVAGMVKEGESATDVALRECLEEAGRAPERLIPICRCYLSPGGCSEQIELFFAEIDSTGMDGMVHGVEEEGEDIMVRVLPTGDAFAALDEGRIINASTIIALQWLRFKLRSY
ncbi:MAG: NUDIX domain-containing protein [Syntrophotaleaceae bacterium]